jgi:predicted permease
LIGAQAALAVLLATGAALTARSYERLAAVDPGFDVDPLAMVSVRAPVERYPTAEGQQQFLDRVRDEIEALPQVQAVTAVSAPPFRTSSGSMVPRLEGQEGQEAPAGAKAEVSIQDIDLRYFDVFGTSLVAGRRFEADDVDQAVMINESFARALGDNVVGRRLLLGGDTGHVIIGVVRDVRSTSLASDPAARPQLYFFRTSTPSAFERFVLRVDGDPAAVIADVRARVSALDHSVPLSEAATFRSLFDAETARHRLVSYLLVGLALFGVVFAMSGVYGVVALDVSRRTREVGVRMALGATPEQVIRALVGRGLRPVAVGAGLGVVASFWTAPFLEDLLFGVPARDPWSALAGVALVLATASASSLLPARRASRVDPAVTLRA